MTDSWHSIVSFIADLTGVACIEATWLLRRAVGAASTTAAKLLLGLMVMDVQLLPESTRLLGLASSSLGPLSIALHSSTWLELFKACCWLLLSVVLGLDELLVGDRND